MSVIEPYPPLAHAGKPCDRFLHRGNPCEWCGATIPDPATEAPEPGPFDEIRDPVAAEPEPTISFDAIAIADLPRFLWRLGLLRCELEAAARWIERFEEQAKATGVQPWRLTG